MPDNTRAIVAVTGRSGAKRKDAAKRAAPKIGMVRFILVADSDAQAMAIARRAYLRWRKSFCHACGIERRFAEFAADAGQFRYAHYARPGHRRLARDGARLPGVADRRTAARTTSSDNSASAISRSARCCTRSNCLRRRSFRRCENCPAPDPPAAAARKSTSRLAKPPISGQKARMNDLHGHFVWYELMTTDMAAARNFYAKSWAGAPATLRRRACPIRC